MSSERILIVDGDASSAAHLEAALTSLGYGLYATVGCGLRAVERAEADRPDLALVDLGLGGELTGPETGERLGRRLDVPVVYLTDQAGPEAVERSRGFGCVLRPFDPRQLHLNIRTALAAHDRERGHGETDTRQEAASELEKTLAELGGQSELMRTTFRSISDGIIVADETGRLLHVNPAAEQIIGDLGDGSPQGWAETSGLYRPDRETPVRAEELPLMRAIHLGESTDEEDLFIRHPKRPEGVHVRVSARPLLDGAGGVRGGVSVFRDVTQRVLAEEALAQAFAQGRLEVVETILHNIGNAINSVTTGIETVRQRLLNDRVGRRLFALAAAVREHEEDWIAYVRDDPQGRKVRPFILELSQGFSSQSEDLIRTVGRVRDRANHIADIVRTQKAAGSPGRDRKDVDLREAISGALRVLRDSLDKRGIDTRIDCRNAPREIRIQESQFHQMLVNLVKNSIEAIDELEVARGLEASPSIRIRASVDDPFLKVEVTDNGIGIRESETEELFAPGYTTKRQGSGLGLHSAANFVIASGGQIQAVSGGTGRGATMRVTLPLLLVAPRVMEEKRVRYPSFSGRQGRWTDGGGHEDR